MSQITVQVIDLSILGKLFTCLFVLFFEYIFNEKFKLMLMRRAKAYSSSGSVY